MSTYEFGYKSLVNNRLFIDLAAYYNTYNNFVTRINAFSPDANRIFSIYTNVEEQLVGYGANLGLEYNLFKDWKLSGNYSFADFHADSAVAKNPGFLPAFNTPKHRFNLSLGSRRAWKNLGFNLRYRWTQGYTWQSPFGQGELPSFQTLDLALFYQLPKLPLAFKLGGTNLLRQEYRTLYGGPMVGSQFYLSIQYDPVAYKVKQPSEEFSSSQEQPSKEQPKKQKNKKSKADKEEDDDEDKDDDEDDDEEEKPKKSKSKPKSNKKKGDNQPSKSLDRFW